MNDLICKTCGKNLKCMGGRSAHRTNWYCPHCDSEAKATNPNWPISRYPDDMKPIKTRGENALLRGDAGRERLEQMVIDWRNGYERLRKAIEYALKYPGIAGATAGEVLTAALAGKEMRNE